MKKVFISLVVSVFIVASISPAYGDITGISSFSDVLNNLIYWCLTPTTAGEGEDEIVAAREYVNSVWRTPGNCDGTVEVTYQSLSDAVISMNSSGIPCKIAMWRGAGSTGYVIKATGSIPICDGATTVDVNGKYFTNISGAVFIAKNNTSGVVTSEQIDSIKEILNNFYDLFNTNSGLGRSIYRIENAVSGLYVDIHNSVMGSIDSLLTTCNGISTKLDTLTSVISNGKVLVDNSDVVTAIQSIPAFDGTEITGYVGSIVEWLTSFSRKYDANYTNIYEKVTSIAESLSFHTKFLSDIKRFAFQISDTLTNAVDADTGKVLVDDSALISAIQASAYDDAKIRSVLSKALVIDLSSVYTFGDALFEGTLSPGTLFSGLTGIASFQYADLHFSYDQLSRLVEIQNNLASLVDKPVTDYTSQLTAVTDKLDALANKPAVDLTAVVASVDNVNTSVVSLNTDLNTKLGSLVDDLQVVVDNSTSNVENVTNIVIDETNNAYNVFYVTTENGDEKPIGEVAGDTLSASGKLLNFLYKLCFEGALSKVDDSITDMDGFYFDDGAGLEGSIWD